MRVTYQPDGADPKVWTGVRRGRIMSSEAEAMERHTGKDFGDLWDALERDNMQSVHALLYVLLKRTIPTLKWDEVQFCLDEITMEFETDEKARLRELIEGRLAAGETLNEATMDYLDELRADLAQTDDGAAEDPKAIGS